MEGTNCGAPLNAALTPELAQVQHMLYEQNQRLMATEKELMEEKAKVVKLEVNENDMAGGIIHLIKGHFGPSEKALRDVTTALLPLIFGCWSMVFGCKVVCPFRWILGNAFVGGAGSGDSSSRSSSSKTIDRSDLLETGELERRGEIGEGERATLSPFLFINKAQIEEGSAGGGGSSFSSGESGSGWFSPERCFLSFKGPECERCWGYPCSSEFKLVCWLVLCHESHLLLDASCPAKYIFVTASSSPNSPTQSSHIQCNWEPSGR